MHAAARIIHPTLRIAVAVVLVATGCSKTVTSKSGASRSTSTTNAKAAIPSSLDWHGCTDEPPPFQCASLTVPVDYSHEGGATLALALVRKQATDSAARVGSLLVNPGGPGGSGIDFVTGNVWSPQISKHFDIVGFDPRGVGQSTPLNCHATLEKMYSVDPDPRTPTAVAKLLTVSKTFVAGCATKYKSLLPFLGTRNVARDMDRIRIALDEKKLTYLGYSYGTSIGQVYADLFPTHVRAMVLDGVVKLGQPGLEAAEDQGKAFETALDNFFANCKTQPGCPLGADPEAVFDRVQSAAKSAPIPTTGNGGRVLSPGEFQLGVGQALYSQQLWPQLASALHAADLGDGEGLLALADQYLSRQPNGTYANGFEIYFAVSCLDWSWPRDPTAYLDAGKSVAAIAPRMGEGIVTDYVRCAYWPTPPQPLTPVQAKGSPAIVVVSTTDDPATPYVNGVELAKELPKGALITKVGTTHTAYGQGDSCVDGPVESYLVTLKAPAPGIRCP